MLGATSVSQMIIPVQSCLLRRGFISAASVSLNDCHVIAAASFSMYEIYPSLHPLTLSLFLVHLTLPPLPPHPICQFYIPRVFLPTFLCLFCRQACPLFFYSTISHLFQPNFLPSFHHFFMIYSFSKSFHHPGSFCLAAPPPLSKPPLIRLWLSRPCALTSIIFNHRSCFLVVMGFAATPLTFFMAHKMHSCEVKAHKQRVFKLHWVFISYRNKDLVPLDWRLIGRTLPGLSCRGNWVNKCLTLLLIFVDADSFCLSVSLDLYFFPLSFSQRVPRVSGQGMGAPSWPVDRLGTTWFNSCWVLLVDVKTRPG